MALEPAVIFYFLILAAIFFFRVPVFQIILPMSFLVGALWGCIVPALVLTGYQRWRPQTITPQTSNLPKPRGDSPFGRDPAWPSYLVGQSRVDLGEMWYRTVGTLRPGWHKCRDIVSSRFNPLARALTAIGLYPTYVVGSIGTLITACAILLICGSVLLVVTAGWLLIAGVLRGGDDLVRRLRGASGSCQSCYHVSSLPAFPCAQCGEIHRDIRPGLLGAVWRRCTCGALLPTTVLRAAFQLRTSCPYCLEPLREGAAVHRDIRLPVFGPASAGKTRLVYAGLLALRNQAVAGGASVELTDERSKHAFDQGTEIVRRGDDTTKTPAGQLPTPITVQITMARRKALLHVFDAAGEFYIDRAQNSDLSFLDRAQGLVFVVDPFSIPWVQNQLGQVMPALANPAIDDPEQVYHVTAGRMRDYGVRTSKQRLAIAVVKADLLADLPPARDLRPNQVREWLLRAGLDNLVLAAERDFAEVRYFLVASVHDTRLRDPLSAANPFTWLIARADRRLLPEQPDPTTHGEEAA